MSNQVVIKLSSTALGKSGCILNFYRTVVEGYKEFALPARVVYGIGVHKFIDVAYKSGGDFKLAIAKAREVFLSIPKEEDRKSPHLSDERHMCTVCINLWTQFVLSDSTFNLIMLGDKPATEVTFEIPYFENEFIKVFLCGTIDKVGQFLGGCFAIGDWKTTSSWNEKEYFTQYELSRQLRYYRLACKLMSEREPDSTLGRVGATRMGAFIDAVFVKPDPNESSFKRSNIFQFDNIAIDAFQASLDAKILEISKKIETGVFNVKEGIINGSCEGKWGKCSFWPCCKNNDKVAELILKQHYRKVEYNPLNYNEIDSL